MMLDDILRKARSDADRDHDTELHELVSRTENMFGRLSFFMARAAVAQLEFQSTRTEASLHARHAAETEADRAKDRFLDAYNDLLGRYSDPSPCGCRND